MPHIASVVDVRRQGFGADQVKVAFAEENGVRLGRQDAGPKAGTCYYCRRWQGTKSGKGWCCISFAPPVARRADESCELFTQEVKS